MNLPYFEAQLETANVDMLREFLSEGVCEGASEDQLRYLRARAMLKLSDILYARIWEGSQNQLLRKLVMGNVAMRV